MLPIHVNQKYINASTEEKQKLVDEIARIVHREAIRNVEFSNESNFENEDEYVKEYCREVAMEMIDLVIDNINQGNTINQGKHSQGAKN